jgi:alpha-beta hydrolase superfamily lysophospholipase
MHGYSTYANYDVDLAKELATLGSFDVFAID